MNDDLPDTSRSIHLSASAGSGKTRALKERYIALLDQLDRKGLGIDQAVAITFTDKAAAEIKERVMQDLPEPLRRKVIRGRQDLRISTIHSFCMNLLKRYPLEAGLPPDFAVLDSRDRADRLGRAVRQTLDDSGGDLMMPLGDYGADEISATVEYLLSIRSRLKRLEIDAGGPEQLVEAVKSGMATDKAAKELGELVTSQEWRVRFRMMEELLRSQGDSYGTVRGDLHRLLAEASDSSAAAEWCEELDRLYFTKEGAPLKKPSIPKNRFVGDRKGYETCFFAIQDLLLRQRDLRARTRAGSEAVSLLRLYLAAEQRYRDAKLREGVQDFDDLEIQAYRLLRSVAAPDILYWLDRKILHFLVDEFQDTSDIQWAILDALTAEIFAGQGADKAMPPTLFVVGDRKQSIYRFREANYRLIDDVRDKMERNLPADQRAVRTLDRNYRSVPEVTGAANQIFGALWPGDYLPADTERSNHAGSVELIEILAPAGTSPLVPMEADLLAQRIRELVERKTAVYKKEDDRWISRPLGYGDCAILIQSRTRLKEYEASLRAAGVPFRVVGGVGFYEQDEIQAIMNVLFVLWNRDDRLSLAAALKSALFGLSDRDLLDLFADRGDALARLAKLQPAVHELLETWARYAGAEPMSGLVRRIVGDTGAYVAFGRRNPQAVFNIDKLLDTAREFDRRGFVTLQDFVAWVKNIREAEHREATADMNLPGFEGAVSIMTVHKAKGLEFSAVFLPGMNNRPRSVANGPRAVVAACGALQLAFKGTRSPIYDELWKQEREELLREHQRLLYVAMTRATDRLAMIGTIANGDGPVKESWLGFVRRSIPLSEETAAAPGAYRHVYPLWERERMVPDQSGTAGPAAVAGTERPLDQEAVLARIRPVVGAEAPEWKRATDFLSEDREWIAEHPLPHQPGGISPLTRGSFLHRCLELLTATGTFDAAAVADEFPELAGADQEQRRRFLAEAACVVEKVTGDPRHAWIFASGEQAYTELSFRLSRGKDIVSGVIDRIVIRDDVAHVIDYKAIAVTGETDRSAWLRHYRPQLRIYADAAKDIFGASDVRSYLLFLDSNELAPYPAA